MCSGIAVLTLNRPEAKNAIGVEMLSKLRVSLENLQFHSSARILIICSGVPDVFCAGADLKVRLIILYLLCSVLYPLKFLLAFDYKFWKYLSRENLAIHLLDYISFLHCLGMVADVEVATFSNMR